MVAYFIVLFDSAVLIQIHHYGLSPGKKHQTAQLRRRHIRLLAYYRKASISQNTLYHNATQKMFLIRVDGGGGK